MVQSALNEHLEKESDLTALTWTFRVSISFSAEEESIENYYTEEVSYTPEEFRDVLTGIYKIGDVLDEIKDADIPPQMTAIRDQEIDDGVLPGKRYRDYLDWPEVLQTDDEKFSKDKCYKD